MRSAAPELLAAFATYLVAAGRSPGTVQLRLYYLERLARVTGGELLTVTAADLMSFLAHPSWSPETRKSARTSLAAFYGWTCAAGYLEHNPAAWLPPVPVPAGVPRPTPDRVLRHALAAAASDRDRLMVLLAAYAGLRRAEIARVRPADFTREGLRVVGKGGRARLVPVHPELAAAVRDELERRAAGGRGTGWRYWSGISLFGPLFPNSAGEPITADVVGRVLSRLLGPGWSAHTLRHRFATNAYAAERDLRAVQELLGHSSPNTTARYVATTTDAKLAAVANVGLSA